MSNEWYTPAKYIEAARTVMGGIDLDPASCEMANQVVRATRYYSQEENGLAQEWKGRVWCNPPYGRTDNKSNIGIWTRRLVQEYHDRNIEQAVLLSTCRPDTPWFYLLWEFPICFADHRIYFYVPKHRGIIAELDTDSGHFHGTIFVYLGPNESAFTEIFSQFGRIVRAIDTPKPRPIARELWAEEVIA